MYFELMGIEDIKQLHEIILFLQNMRIKKFFPKWSLHYFEKISIIKFFI